MNTQRRLSSLFLATALAAALDGPGCGPARRPDGGEGLLNAPAAAPAFRAPDQAGQVRTLEEFRGHVVVLYFYPRDGTPGCTREACAFRDAWTRLQATGAQVLGVSSDDVASHARFAQEHHLPFPLLADTEGRIARAYGVGQTLGMDARVTFLISPDGRVARVYPHVDPAVHADEVIRAIGEIAPAPAAPAPAAPAATPTT